MKPRLMFINAINPTMESEVNMPHLGIGYLAASLWKEFGKDSLKIKVVDRDIEKGINDFKPDIVGITSVSSNYGLATKYAHIAKKHGLPVIVGGTHISTLPQTMTSDMDVAVIGEGEETIIDIYNAFEASGELDKRTLENIAGIAFKENGRLTQTKRRKLIEPLDKLPFPARDIFRVEKTAYMFSSRGCSYRCVFCASSHFWNKIRFFSAEYVVNEIRHIVENYKVKRIFFWDDFLIADKKRIEGIYNLLRKEGIPKEIVFNCICRADYIDHHTMRLLKKMNFDAISIGFESGNQRVLKYLKSNTTTVEMNIKAVNIIKRNGLTPSGTFIVGSPNETEDEILDTLNFIKESKIDSFNVFVLTPLPGTPIWEYAKSKGLVSDDMEWELLRMDSIENLKKTAIILSEKVSRERLYELLLDFKKYMRKKGLMLTIRKGLKEPWRFFYFIRRNIERKIRFSNKLLNIKELN